MPPCAEHLWAWFTDLSRPRGNNGFGMTHIGWGDIVAWLELSGISLAPWEMTALIRLDAEIRNAMAEKQAEKSKGEPR